MPLAPVVCSAYGGFANELEPGSGSAESIGGLKRPARNYGMDQPGSVIDLIHGLLRKSVTCFR